MESVPPVASGTELEQRAAFIADPGIDMQRRINSAGELRELIDVVRDSEAARVLPNMITNLLELVRTGEPAFRRDTPEFQLRRAVVDIIHRVPYQESLRPLALTVISGLLDLLRNDNEENGVTCCKTIIDLVRYFRLVNEEIVSDFMAIFTASLHNMKDLVLELLSEDSKPMDPNVLLPSTRSFRVLAEMCMTIVTFSQSHRQLLNKHVPAILPLNFEILTMESPTQKQAREDYEAMGGFWTGVAPAIKNLQAYGDFVQAQIKMISYSAYILRGLEEYNKYGDTLVLTGLRLFQDCPPNAVGSRRDLIIVMRHLLSTTPYRRALLPHVDKLFDEDVLLGKGIGARETLRASVYVALADFVHHLRPELTTAQMARITHVYATLMHNSSLMSNVHLMFAKVIISLADSMVQKDNKQIANKALMSLLESCIERLEAMNTVYEEVKRREESQKQGEQTMLDYASIDKTRPVGGAMYAFEKEQEVVHESRLLFRPLVLCCRTCLVNLKRADGPVPDGILIARLFESCIKGMSLYDNDAREANDAMEAFGQTLAEVNLHVVQEVWTQKMGFFFDAARNRPGLLQICQSLFGKEAISPTLIAIVLRFLTDRLAMLGDSEDQTAVVTIRLYKMAFAAVGIFSQTNEPILAAHMGKLIMACFPLAAKAAKPSNYYFLLRALFRAIGGGGGRFELLYKEVLPLLPELLESLNRQLQTFQGLSRDMIVELCLTVPLRLTHLLPHLQHLMRPLVFALHGPPELVSQGLRTLELCIDNLTPDFLDPTLNTVLRELSEAVYSHLKPLPANLHHATCAARILGKLGGRNRRLLSREPFLNCRPCSEPATLSLSFGGRIRDVDLGPMSTLALRALHGPASVLRSQAYEYLENCLTVLSHDGLHGSIRQEVFTRCLEGAFDAVHIPDVSAQAEEYIRKLSQVIFRAEPRRTYAKDVAGRRWPSPLLSCYLEALPHTLTRDNQSETEKAQELVTAIIKELIDMGNNIVLSPQEVLPTFQQIAGRFSALCFEDSWARKSAGCAGIKVISRIHDVGVKWITDREVDLVRNLLHVLKDLPSDLPRDVDEVLDVLTCVLRVSNSELAAPSGQIAEDTLNARRSKIVHLAGIFFSELSSAIAIVRRAVQMCIGLLAEISGKPVVELLLPHRDRLLAGIYTKPLRAVPLQIQIGMIEAIRYCIELDPPLPELNEELLRLLHETLALADADDANLLGRGNPRQGGVDIINLRVASIKLLTASMPITDFFSKHTATRQRVTSVYFKSLYSSSPEVKDVAHEGLRTVLTHQSRLPKELLQTGLRPILMNLADPKRLSVPGLEGLARLLELLTNYFKVEIGHKLLDHFRVVADPQMLQESSRLPLSENEGITKLVRLANIFHLLPSAANIFLESLVNSIVQTEAQMQFSGQSPFSEPLGKYLDKYPYDALEFFMKQLHFPRHMRTLRTILQANLAPSVLRELASRTSSLVATCFYGSDQSLVLPGLQLCSDLNKYVPGWLHDNAYALDGLVHVWNMSSGSPDQIAILGMDSVQSYALILSIFQEALEKSPRIDILFEIVTIYTRSVPMDLMKLSHFLHRHVALNESLAYKRNILTRFLLWFKNPAVSWPRKAYFLRYVVTPMLLTHASGPWAKQGLLDAEIIAKVLGCIWTPMLNNMTFSDTDGMCKVEMLHFTTIMVQHYHDMLGPVKKEVIRLAWDYINHEDPVVKQTAYLLAARFFEAFDTPSKFILRAWTGLLKQPHTEVRTIIRQALDIIAPVLLRPSAQEQGSQSWAKTTRRLLAEEGTGLPQVMIVYQVIVRQPQLFYPFRALFVPHMVNCLTRLGLSVLAHNESRLLSIDILQVIFDWDQKTLGSEVSDDPAVSAENRASAGWVTPLPFRETMVSYLVRLATAAHEPQARNVLVTRALALLRTMVSTVGWSDVTVKLHYFSRTLEQNDFSSEATLSQAISSAKVLQVVSADKEDAWYNTNATILQKLVRKGLMTDETALHDALHPVFDRLIRLFPPPPEDEEQQGDMSEFHRFVYSTIGECLRNGTNLRGILLMLKSVVQAVPERVKHFSGSITKVLQKLARDHTAATPGAPSFEAGVNLCICLLDVCQLGILFLGDDRGALLRTLVHLADKSKSQRLCQYLLQLARDWAVQRREAFPTVKEKAALLQKMVAFEGRGDDLFSDYLNLIYDIYTDPSLRRSDLTTRLEQSFLIGCRCRKETIRDKFMDLLDSSIPRNLSARLAYILGVQSWEALADCNWIYLALYLLLGTVDADHGLVDERKGSLDPSLFAVLSQRRAHEVVRPLQRLLFLDSQVAHETWITIFPAVWDCLSRREQTDITQHMMVLLSKEYHLKQADLRPNVIQSLLTGLHACSPPVALPPHLLKYLGKTYGCWHVSLELLEGSLDHHGRDEAPVREAILDSLSELTAELCEDDVFYGVWRRRGMHSETNIALAFEQNGMWEQAAIMYETAQSKTRSGALAFTENEYCLWEDHWMLSAEKLQQWDILYELARNEGNVELQLESAWRIKNWADERVSLEDLVNILPDAGTPRRRVFEAFISLLKLPESHGPSGPNAANPQIIANATQEVANEVTRILEDALQLSLRKWVALPPYLSAAHIPLLQHFQQFVELQEAIQIFNSLAATNAQNLEKKSSDLKMVLQAWRERLPDRCDDISLWSDLVAWRQNVFHAINKRYLPLIQQQGPSASGNGGTSNTFGYRGFHETAWIINRFAHVARKHDLLDVCFTYLNKIYTLPNIEISEAFLKLREQARCHYQKPNDLQAGLEVINNTNLMYFTQAQKAEFFTLKGMFHARVGRYEEANHAFGSAVQLDMNQAKAWAEWGKFNDRMFKERPNDMTYAAHAVSCYLQAAGLHKSGKSRPLLTRVLWLLSVDDGNYTISRAFDTYKGDAAFWYWITLIPQLCLSISQREVKQARYLLLNLAKLYPQALFFPLRTTKEDMMIVKKQAAQAAAARASAGQGTAQQAVNADPTRRNDGDHPMRESGAEPHDGKKEAEVGASSQPPAAMARPTADGTTQDAGRPNPSVQGTAAGGEASQYYPMRQSWEYIEEIVNILKTAFPLLILSLETLVDQINQRFKASPEEDIYRFVCMLLLDGINTYLGRVAVSDDDGQLPPQTHMNLQRMVVNLTGSARKDYEEDFLKSKLSQLEYIGKLQQWRDRYEKYLDSRPRLQPLDMLSHYLTEFQYGKFDEIEVPGQYTEDKDNNQNFARVQKFGPKFENCRSHGYCWKRLTIHGTDNSKTTFAVQLPSGRHCRREERVMQLLRTFNGTLNRKKESRKRNLAFHLPAAVSCGANLRLMQNDSSYVTLGDIYDHHCEETGASREDPVLVVGEKVKTVLREFHHHEKRLPNKAEYFTLRKDVLTEVMEKVVPDDILTRYMLRTMEGPSELWRMRKQFTLQIASTSFMTYVLCLTSRLPSRFHVSRNTGLIAMSELLPGVAQNLPHFASPDMVPFRLTPNMQRFVGENMMEGLLPTSILAIGRSLTEPEFDLEQQLCLFARDEVITWLHNRAKGWNAAEIAFRNHVANNITVIVKNAETMACKLEREQAAQNPTTPPSAPVVQTITNLISQATNPVNLAKMQEQYSPWF
ncbi:FAT-domain-containing protein [Neolentinus lepideus HHB14362 ss-1]|uniref:FAT-domain-containing protein n=1 Tax=Neolentinus lepideus HHB14362 ss-1 TaxID=1314782 RepID=A0A165TLZ1_9AGAM|nr:FAT-domain-containing protein [Neolentinus lepideus HHB14362 ss-1]